MGCDIHLVLETAEAGPGDTFGPWTYQHDYPYIPTRALRLAEGAAPNTGPISWRIRGRDYGFFSLLAGVRGHGPAPKGVPDDASQRTKELIEGWGSDGHSHTWYDADEFATIYGQLEHVRACYVAEKMAGSLKRGDGSETSYEIWLLQCIGADAYDKHRVIIWFDN